MAYKDNVREILNDVVGKGGYYCDEAHIESKCYIYDPTDELRDELKDVFREEYGGEWASYGDGDVLEKDGKQIVFISDIETETDAEEEYYYMLVHWLYDHEHCGHWDHN